MPPMDWMQMTAERGEDGIRRCGWCGSTPDYAAYHDDEWGRPVTDDVRLYEKLCLEGFQSGLSWLTILRKRENFRAAFAGFDPAAVAAFGTDDVDRLLGDAGIVRHRGKIEATIANAARRPGRTGAVRVAGRAGVVVRAPTTGPPGARRGWASWRRPPRSPPRWPRSSSAWDSGSWARPPCYAAMQSVGVVNDHLRGCHVRTACDRDRRATSVPVLPG